LTWKAISKVKQISKLNLETTEQRYSMHGRQF